MEKYLSSGGDKSSKNYSSKIFNSTKEKNKNNKNKPKPETLIGNKIFFNTNNKSNLQNIDNNSLYDIQDNLFIPKMVYSNNMLGEKNKYNNIRLNSRGERSNNIEDETLISKYKDKLNKMDIKIVELKEELKQLEKYYNDNNKNLMKKHQNNNKTNNRNIFLFYNSSRNGNNINNININNKNNKKENKIIYKNNIYNLNRKVHEKKKPKSTPKIGGYINDIKNNYFFLMSNKKMQKNINFFGSARGKTLDFKNKTANNKNSNNMNNQLLINSININNVNQSNNVKKINVNNSTNDNNISKEIPNNNNSSNITVQKKDKFNDVKKNWKNYPKTEPTDNLSKISHNSNSKNDKKKISIYNNTFSKMNNINENNNVEDLGNINYNNSTKNNIYYNDKNMVNSYTNNNFKNNLNIYINKNVDNISNQNSYNNSNRNSNNNSNNKINSLMKSKNSNTPTSPNSNYLNENKKFKFENDILYDEKNKFEILENNIQFVFNQYFHYYDFKNNSNKK